MEDIPDGEQVLAGTFSLNGCYVIILFDSGATHDFISMACTQKCQLSIGHMSSPYMIRTPAGNVVTQLMVMAAPLNLAGRLHKTNLIVLEGQGIDVILDMGWMKKYRAMLDISTRMVHLESFPHGVTTLQLSLSAVANASIHNTTAESLEDILIV
jgi:hypothetical protein